MKSVLWAYALLALCLSTAGCKKDPEGPDGEKLTASGHEIPEPVDDSIIEKSDEDPEPPVVK